MPGGPFRDGRRPAFNISEGTVPLGRETNLSLRSALGGRVHYWGRGAVGQSDRPGTFRVRQGTVFFAAVTLAVAAFWSPLSPPLSQNSPGISPPAGRPRRPPHRWPRGGVCAEDRSGSASNKTPQPHGQLLRLSGRRRTEPQFFHSSPRERAASFVFAFCVFLCKSRAPVPLALQPAGYAVAWRFASPVFGVRKVLEGRSRCEKQRTRLIVAPVEYHFCSVFSVLIGKVYP